MAQSKAKALTLYYFPTSFSSQKVLFAAYEKDIKFKPKLVSLFSGQHNEPWYVKLNPEGYHIPVLQLEEKVIVEPSEIVDYFGKLAEGAGHPLVPSLSSELGKEASELREKLDSIPIDILSYGIIYHPHLSPSGCKLAGAVQRSMKDNFAKRLSLLTELATKHPDLRDAYLSKSQIAASKFDIITDETQIKTQLTDIDPLFTTLEEQLEKIKKVGSDISDELWLFGPMFTAADISLSAILSRLTLLGLDSRYFSPDKCPCLHNYYQQLQKRPAYQKIQTQIANLKMTLLWENFKTASPYILTVLGIGTATGVGYYAYKKMNS